MEATTIVNLGTRGQVTSDKILNGSVLVLIQFDVCEEIKLDDLRRIFGARTAEASFKHPAPGYVQYQRPPVVEPIDIVKAWGPFKTDPVNVSALGKNNAEAVRIMDRAGWR